MATPNVGILTNAGKDLIDRVNAGQTKITFSKIVFSSMNNNQLTDDQIKALTTVAPQEIVVNNPKVTLDNNTGETRIRATGNNKALNDGVYVKTYAVYAKDGSSNEILYGITVSPNPNYLPEYDGVTPQAVTYSYKVNISNTSNITFTNSNDVYVSDTDLDEALQPYAKTVDVNQQLDKKVNVADMRKPANDVAGLEDVSASVYQNQLAKGTDIHKVTKDGIYPLGNSYINFIDSYSHWGTLQVINTNLIITHIVKIENSTIWTETCSGSPMRWGPWHKLSFDDEVFHSTITQLFSTDMDTVLTDGFYRLASGTNGIPNEDEWAIYQVIPLSSGSNGVQLAYGTNNTVLGMRSWNNGNHFTNWVKFADDSKVVHSKDMRKPASDVAGIEEVNTKQDKIGYTPADDSKVVHTTDTSNWQKYPITDVTGALTAYIGASYQYTSIKRLLDTSVNGVYTIYVDEGTSDTPDSSDNLRGIIQMQNNHVWGIFYFNDMSDN